MDTIYVAVASGEAGLGDVSVGILTAVGAAIVTGVLVWLFYRVTLVSGLKASVNLRLGRLAEYRQFVASLRDHIAANEVPGYGAKVTPEESDFYYDVRGDLYKYLGPRSVERLMNFHSVFARVEILLKGLGDDLLECRSKQTRLSAETHQNIIDRMDRIEKLIDLFPSGPVRDLSQLPRAEHGVATPGKVLRRGAHTSHDQV